MSYGVLQHLIDSLAGAARNPVTPAEPEGVTPAPAPLLACTLVTPVTPANDETGRKAARPHRLTPEQADRCHAPCWNDDEIATFVRRHARLMSLGYSDGDADDLAERLTLRDRDGDDRRMCVECAHCRPLRCGNHHAAGIHASDISVGLAVLPQRCPAWTPQETPWPEANRR